MLQSCRPVSFQDSNFAQIYDSTQPGRTSTGHTCGDDLTKDERMEVIEYLKTL